MYNMYYNDLYSDNSFFKILFGSVVMGMCTIALLLVNSIFLIFQGSASDGSLEVLISFFILKRKILAIFYQL